MPPRATSCFPMLSVASLDVALRFYRDVLGGVAAYQFPTEGDPSFIVLRLGTSDVGLGAMTDAPPIHGQAMRPATGHRVELCVYVTDVDEMVEALRATGAPVVREPVEQPWGERIAYVEDPDGNLVMLAR